MVWVQLEPLQRRRQVALFAVSAAASAILERTGLWPDDSTVQAVVTAWLYPNIDKVSKVAAAVIQRSLKPKS